MRARISKPRIIKLLPVALIIVVMGVLVGANAPKQGADLPPTSNLLKIVDEPTPTPIETPYWTATPLYTQQPTATPIPVVGGDIFSDSKADATPTGDTRADAAPATIQAPAPATAPAPTAAPTSDAQWSYITDTVRIEVREYEIKNVVYFAAEVWLTDAKQWLSAFSSNKFDAQHETVEDIAARNNAVLAINGDFATFNNGGVILRNGEVFRTNKSTRQLMLLDSNGDLIPIIEPPTDGAGAAKGYIEDGIWQSFVFGPVLVENGEAVPIPDAFFINTGAVEPRTAIAQLGPLHYLWVVVDGRQDGYSQGVSLARLQEIMISHGAVTAFNLDGGGSSTLYFDGKVLNRPANGSARRVPDILYVGY